MKTKPVIAVCVTSLGATKQSLKKAKENLEPFDEYFEVLFDERLLANDRFGSRSVDDRLASLKWAFERGDIVMAWDGGFNSVELLDRLDEVPAWLDKYFVGYSDNTVLGNALAVLKKCRVLYGPCMDDVVKKPARRREIAKSLLAQLRGDIATINAQYNKYKPSVIQPGIATGRIWGGNNYSFDLLQGTESCPVFTEPFFLFMEGEDILKEKKYVWRDFIRNIDSIMLLPGARQNLQGLVIGKFPASYRLRKRDLQAFVMQRAYLAGLPLVVDFPCGHNHNSLYLPIGEAVRLVSKPDNTIKMSKV